MPDLAFLDFKVADLFDIERGNTKYIRRYYHEHPGIYPVYSASTFEESVAGWIDTFDFDCECLTWTTNGYAGQVFRREGRFSATRDVGVLIAKPEFARRLSLDYFVPALTTAFTSAATGRLKESGERDYTKIATKMAGDVFVSVPVDGAGHPDFAAQDEIAGRFRSIERTQCKLLELADHLEALNIGYPDVGQPSAEFTISELFEKPVRGDGRLTRGYMRAHPGRYPVYTGSSIRNEVAGYVDSYAFEGLCITWVADGYAGHAFVRGEKFNANSHCGVLKLREQFRPTVYLPFVELFLTPILLDAAVGRFRDDGSPDYTRVTTGMVEQCRLVLPTDAGGNPDLERQITVADRMQKLRVGKQQLISLLRNHGHVKVAVAGLGD